MVRGHNTRAAISLLGRPGTRNGGLAIATDITGVAPARRAVPPLLAAYWTFGQYWGVWVVVFAEYLRWHALSPGEAGLQFGAMAAVSIVVMTLVAPRLQHLPQTVVVPAALAAMGVGAYLVAYLPTPWLWIAFVMLGIGNGMIDVFVNVAAQGVEASIQRPVLQWLHAAYSVGGITGALGAGIALSAGISFRVCLAATALMLFGAASWNHFSPALTRAARSPSERLTRVSLTAFARTPMLIVPALVILSAFLVEGSMDVWSVIYLRHTLGASILAGAMAFAAFALAMTIGRAFAARILFDLGYRRTILVSGVGSLVAGIGAAVAGSPVIAAIAFLPLGFFIAAAAPAAFGLVEGSGEHPAVAIAAMTTVGYAGFVVGPPIMGWLAQTAGLRATIGLMVLATAGVALGGIFAPTRAEAELESLKRKSRDPNPSSEG
jgi:predicted MFS family arabinose efflux permease